MISSIENTASRQIENDEIKFWIEDAILFCELKNPIKLTMENLPRLIQMRHEISENQKQYWCLDIRLLKAFQKEAMAYSNEHGEQFLHACAVIVSKQTSKFIYNVYHLLYKTKLPYKAFTSKEKAIVWLNEIRTKNEN